MNIKYQAEFFPDYLLVTCEGVHEHEALKQIYTKALEEAVANQRNYVIVDSKLVQGEPPSLTQRYDIGAHIAQFQSTLKQQVAFLVVADEPFVSKDRFGETVALNRGALGKVFTELDHAIDWIKLNLASKSKTDAANKE